MMAAAVGSQCVISLESKEMSELLSSQLLHANGLDQVEIIPLPSEHLTPGDLWEFWEEDEEGKGPDVPNEEKVQLLMAEPFFFQMQNWQLTQCLSFWYRRNSLREFLSPSAIILPCRATLYCQAMSMEALWSTHGKVGTVSGFSHKKFDTIIDSWDSHEYAFPLWDYDCHPVTDPHPLMTFDLNDHVKDITNCLKMPATFDGTCHAVILWIQYHLTPSKVLSEDKPYWKHSVRFLGSPFTLEKGKSIVEVTGSFVKYSAETSFQIKVIN